MPRTSSRRRAPIACTGCKTDKKRCDVTHGVPCSRCVLQHQDCQVTRTNRYRRLQPSQMLNIGSHDPRSNSPSQEPLSLDLPHFIESPSKHLDPSSLEYLRQQGVFDLPQQDLRNELLKCYVDYVQPFSPVLDLPCIMQVIWKQDSTEQICLLLFWAMMFAASAFINSSHLQALGFKSRRAARQRFFRSAKLLYNFELGQPRIATLQATLLMTYGYETPDHLHDAWYWLGTAITWAKALGIDCAGPSKPSSTPGDKLRRRLWWSCCVRDRIIAIGLRRPMHIEDEMPSLTIDDFDSRPLPLHVAAMIGFTRSVDNRSAIIKSAQLAIQLGTLCGHIGTVLRLQFPKNSDSFPSEQKVRCLQHPQVPYSHKDDKILQADQDLDDWFCNLEPDAKYCGPEFHGTSASPEDPPALIVHKAMLACLYFTTSTTLHRPQYLSEHSTKVGRSSLQELSSVRVRVAANEVVKVYMDLKADSLIQYLPHMGVMCLIPHTLVHFLDSRTIDPRARSFSAQKAEFCIQILQELCQTYASADYALVNLLAAKHLISHCPIETEGGGCASPKPDLQITTSSLLQSMTMSAEERYTISSWLQASDDDVVDEKQDMVKSFCVEKSVKTVAEQRMHMHDNNMDSQSELTSKSPTSESTYSVTRDPPNWVNHVTGTFEDTSDDVKTGKAFRSPGAESDKISTLCESKYGDLNLIPNGSKHSVSERSVEDTQKDASDPMDSLDCFRDMFDFDKFDCDWITSLSDPCPNPPLMDLESFMAR